MLIYGLLAVGVYFTFRLGLLQILHFGEMIRTVKDSRSTDREGITPFQALTISLAPRVGAGNLAGVAVAIYLGGPGGLTILRVGVLLMVVRGAYQTVVATVFKTADASMGLMATINLVASLLLSGAVAKLTKDYFDQRKAGVEPVFHSRDCPELGDQIDHSIWTRDGHATVNSAIGPVLTRPRRPGDNCRASRQVSCLWGELRSLSPPSGPARDARQDFSLGVR